MATWHEALSALPNAPFTNVPFFLTRSISPSSANSFKAWYTVIFPTPNSLPSNASPGSSPPGYPPFRMFSLIKSATDSYLYFDVHRDTVP